MMTSTATAELDFEVIPSIDIIEGDVVRLIQGDYAAATSYGTVERVVQSWRAPEGTCVHLVDLDGTRSARFGLDAMVRRLSARYRVQAAGGIRTADDVSRAIDAGAHRVVVGTMAMNDDAALRRSIAIAGEDRLVVALDLLGGKVRIAGWTVEASAGLGDALRRLEDAGVRRILVTDIARDGMMSGPSFELYRDLHERTPMRILASGGVARLADIRALARSGVVSGVIAGRALQEQRFSVEDALRASAARTLPVRIIPCLDIRDGRVVKGVRFEGIRDAGDPVECARRYESCGADEIVVLDISATRREEPVAIDTVRRIAAGLFIPLTVGGGVRTTGDFRALLRAGADRVAINSAAVADPSIIERCAREFGVQAVVLAVDARRAGSSWEVVIHGGTKGTGLDVVEWCRRCEQLGAGEILLTSIDRDGTASGFDIDLLRELTSAVGVGVIASGGAGAFSHFREAVESGGADALLAASLFHDGRMSIPELKSYLVRSGIEVRR